jgi:hypothetical protein
MATTPVTAPATTALKQIKVRSVSPAGLFRRLGREFTHAGTTLNVSDLSDKEWAVLKAEKMLVLQAVEPQEKPNQPDPAAA